MRTRIVVFVAVIQSILFLAHWLLYATWTSFVSADPSRGDTGLAVALGSLSICFGTVSFLSMRFSNPTVRYFYMASAVWTGFLSFFVLAACVCWSVALIARIAGIEFDPHWLAMEMFGLALLVGLYGVVNAAWIRVKRVTVRLPNLPAGWQGRVAALVSDLHLGNVRNLGFSRRVAAILTKLRPEAIFIAGDLFDGTAGKLDRLARPLGELRAPLGTYFIAGNHEEFHDHSQYLAAVAHTGICVLDGESVTVDGLQIVGVHYRDSTNPDRFRSILRGVGLDRTRASLLLTHAPNHLAVPETEGIALELCGHTHGGQFFPFRWLPKTVYGRYVYGLHRIGNLLVYTSSGVGTWGPPLRIGTTPEIVLIQFESNQAP